MKKNILSFGISAIVILAGCAKEIKSTPTGPTSPAIEKKSKRTSSLSSCQPFVYLLSRNPVGGDASLYSVTGSPNNLPIVSTPILGSAGTNRLQNCLGAAIIQVTGLAYDPGAGVFYGTTGPSNEILSFTDPSCVTKIPATTSGCPSGFSFNLRDLERDPATGDYYALSDGHVVQVDVNTGVCTCVPSATGGTEMKGLTFACTGQMYILETSFTQGKIHVTDKTTGLVSATYGPFYMIPPNFDLSRDAGLHFDCTCMNQFITGHQNNGLKPNLPVEMTDYLPAAMGGPIYDSVSGFIPRTIDFARP